MANKQLFKFEKGKIVAYNHYGQSLCDIAKKSSQHHSSVDVFLKTITGNYHENKVLAGREKHTVFDANRYCTKY